MQPINLYSEISCLIDGTAENSYESIEIRAKLSEKYNFKGALIYYFHFALDPWVVATKVLQSTEQLIPLVAVQPYSIPPVTLAKTISSIAALYGRKISLNLITGANDNELLSVKELTNPEQKYDRLKEYAEILKSLLCSNDPLTYSGQYYNYAKLINYSAIGENLMPDFFIPGSSDASIRLSHTHADSTLLRPQPVNSFVQDYMPKIDKEKIRIAIRLSIIARPESNEAWEIARAAFPISSYGKKVTKMRKNLQSHNSRMMASLADDEVYDTVFWMGAFQSGKSADAFLIGSYKEVADYLLGYINAGVNEILLGHLETEEDFIHITKVMNLVNITSSCS